MLSAIGQQITHTNTAIIFTLLVVIALLQISGICC